MGTGYASVVALVGPCAENFSYVLYIYDSFFKLWIDCYKYSFFPRTISRCSKRSQYVLFSFCSAVLKIPASVKNNFWAVALQQ